MDPELRYGFGVESPARSGRRVFLIAGLAATATGAAGWIRPARAEQSTNAAAMVFVGRYRFVGGAKEARRLEHAIDELAGRMNILIRGIARRRMTHANQIPPQLSIAVDQQAVTVRLPGKRPIAAAIDGRKVHWVDEYGDDVQVAHQVRQGRFVQKFVGDNGSRTITYELNKDGAGMKFHVGIFSSLLPKPLRYSLSYRRT